MTNDYVDKIEGIVEDLRGVLLNDVKVLQAVIDVLHHKRKFRFCINGIGGNWVNTNIQVSIGSNRWEHYSIHNREEQAG